MITRPFDDSDLLALLDTEYTHKPPMNEVNTRSQNHTSEEQKTMNPAPTHVPHQALTALRTSFEPSPAFFFFKQQAMDTGSDDVPDKKKEEKARTPSKRQLTFLRELHLITEGIKHLSLNDSSEHHPMQLNRQMIS